MNEIELRELLSKRAFEISEIQKVASEAIAPHIETYKMAEIIAKSYNFNEISKQLSDVVGNFKSIQNSIKPITELAKIYGESIEVISNNSSDLELSDEQLEDLSNLKTAEEFEEELENLDEEKISKLKIFIQKTSNNIAAQVNDYSNYRTFEDYLIRSGLSELYPELSFLFMTIDIGLIFLVKK